MLTMKKLLLPFLAAALITPVFGQTTTPPAASTIPTITLTTAAGILGGKGTLIGTAKGVATTTGTGTSAVTSTSRIDHVFYQREGETKWRKAKLANRGTDVTWLVDVKITGSVGRRYIFRAVDTQGRESDVVGRRFKKTS
jgi:hypothetical protein